MRKTISIATFALLLVAILVLAAPCGAQTTASGQLPVTVFVFDRTRVDAWQWFAAPPESNSYGYVESLLRVGVAQSVGHWDWLLELSQPAELGLPDDAVSPVSAQGQLGLGATYYASNGNNTDPAAAFFKQGFIRFHFGEEDKNLRLGRFEFVEGQELQPKNPAIKWLQTARIAQRLVGNFGFSNAQRSFDGVEGHFGSGAWDLTAMTGRADQGVFNMNGNPELNVDLQYLAFSQSALHQHVLWRAFAIGYHDGRTGLTKTDNRSLSVRKQDTKNIRIGTYGGDLLAAVPAGPGQFDVLFWGALQSGSWGEQSDSANAAAVEAGYRLTSVDTKPWLRGGWFRSSGDSNPSDNKHDTFFQVLPTPRVYARIPFYNLMNSTDEFVQAIDAPIKKLALRSDLHWLQLTSGRDLWYQGGGAFDNKVFGYVGRPGNGLTSFASIADISAGWQARKNLTVNFYYGYSWGKSVVKAIYPTEADTQYGYAELTYKWGVPQRHMNN